MAVAHLKEKNDEVIAVWRVNKENHTLFDKQVLPYLCIPCLWPAAILGSPCWCTVRQTTVNILAGTVFILGKKNLYRVIDVKTGSCQCALRCVPKTWSQEGVCEDL